MSFDTGSASVRVFELDREIDDEAIEGLAKNAISIPADQEEERQGWATHRHLLDSKIDDSSIRYAGSIRLSLVSATKKIPSGLMNTECKMEEMAEMQATGRSFLKRQEKNEIKKAIKERLLPDMPLNLSGIEVVINDKIMWATATTDKKADELTLMFKAATGINISQITPEYLCAKAGHDYRQVNPSSFVENGMLDVALGEEFLTWAWYMSDLGKPLTDGTTAWQLFLEGPLTFISDGDGAQEAVLRKGIPSIATEAKAALLSGKRLSKAKLSIALNDEEVWSCKIDCQSFTFSSLKVPKSPEKDSYARFEDNMIHMETFMRMIGFSYNTFIQLRLNKEAWNKEIKDMSDWIQAKTVK